MRYRQRAKNNLVLEKESHIPGCFEQPIHWHGYKYIAILAHIFKKI